MSHHRPVTLSFLALFLACEGGDTTAAPPPSTPASVSIVPTETTLAALAQTVQLTATVRDQSGRAITGSTLEWTSSHPAVATVDAGGLVTAVANGSAHVTGTVQGSALWAAVAVTVEQQATELRLSSATEDLRALGDTLRLLAEVLDANQHTVENAAVTWSSSDESVVRVDGSGLVTAVGNGSTSVTAAAANLAQRIDFTVFQLVVVVEVPPTVDTVRALGDTLRIVARALDANGNPVEEARFSWSSSDESVATVDTTGLVTSVAPGAVDITATVASAGVGAIATLLVQLREWDILAAFHRATGGSNWTRAEYWLTDRPVAWWFGVETDARGRVTALSFNGNKLTGTLPPELGYLPELRKISIQQEVRLTGPIPHQLGKIANLEEIRLSNNALTGPIPAELGGLANLRSLYLDRNGLEGSIPTQLAILAKLEVLHLADNALSGPILPDLGELAKLKSLFLGNNRLTGSIPPELGNLEHLAILHLGVNELTGEIPEALGKLGSLQGLYLYRNNLSGEIPADLGNLSRLRQLHLAANSLTGSIPPELGKLEHLAVLDLGVNELTGPIPFELGNLANLHRLNLRWNELSGYIPPTLGSLANLVELSLNRNSLAGAIPRELSNLANLRSLSLQDNALTSIPSELGNLSNLRSLLLAGNRLSGSIPVELGGLPHLRQLYLNQNDLTGSIPQELGGLSNLTELDLGANRLSGALPPDLGHLAHLRMLNVHNNGLLSGPVPQEYVNLALTRFWWWNTRLCAPPNRDFQTWLASIQDVVGEQTCAAAAGR